MCPSSRRYLSYSLCSRRQRNSISVQSHLQVHRWCIVHKQPRIQKLSGPDVSCWTWDQGHHREHHFCFLPWFTPVDWEGWSTSIYDKRDDFNFHITNFPFLSSNIPSLPAYGDFIPQPVRYARACSLYTYECFILRARRLSSKLLKQGYLVERLKSSFRKFYCWYGDLIQQYEVSLSRMLNDILTIDQQCLLNWSDIPPILWPWYRTWPSLNYEWFPWSICNGCGMPAGNAYTSSPPPPFWDLLLLQLLGSDSSNLPCLYSTFHLEYPLVLSRFCIIQVLWEVMILCLYTKLTTPVWWLLSLHCTVVFYSIPREC